MSLGEIAKHDHNGCGEDLRQYGIDFEILYQYLQQDIVESEVEKADHEIAKELDSSF